MIRLGGGPQVSKFQNPSILGRGAFGTAYLVSAASGEQVVLKRVEIAHMNDSQREEAEKECNVLATVGDHPFIIRMRSSFVEVGRLWIVMDYADGGDLARQIANQLNSDRTFDEEQVLDWFVQICLALRFAHERKVLHRDVKPQNVFLMRSGAVRLGDFGISKTLGSTMSLALTTVGTPLYLAPEVCQGEPYNAKGDAWAVGAVLHELCTLRPPFNANNMPQLMMAICRQEPPSLPAAYARAAPLVARLLVKDALDRPSVSEVLAYPELSARVERVDKQGVALAASRRSSNSSNSSGGGAANEGPRLVYQQSGVLSAASTFGHPPPPTSVQARRRRSRARRAPPTCARRCTSRPSCQLRSRRPRKRRRRRRCSGARSSGRRCERTARRIGRSHAAAAAARAAAACRMGRRAAAGASLSCSCPTQPPRRSHQRAVAPAAPPRPRRPARARTRRC